MPSKNPRLSVVLPPSLAATLAAIAVETGESTSSLVRGILEQTEPALVRMLGLVKAANAAKGQIGGGVATSLHRVVEELQDAVDLADARAARVTKDLVSMVETVDGRKRAPAAVGGARGRRGPAPAGKTPGPVTRGSGGSRGAKTAGRRASK